MKDNKPTSEVALYSLAFLLALVLRFYQLGAGALSEVESGWALQALGLARGISATVGPQPLYVLFTSVLFSIVKDTNFLARFLPALVGSLLIWLPFCFRRLLGDSDWLRRAGMVMAFGLALDPGLVSLSRQAGSMMPALVFTLFALAGLYNRRMVWAGVCAALALLSGVAFLQGLLILGLSWGLFALLRGRMVEAPLEENSDVTTPDAIPAASIRLGVISFLLTVLFIGSMFFLHPQGLGALADTLQAFLKSWVTSSGIPALRLPGSLLVYQLIVVIFAIIGAMRAWLGHWDDQQPRLLLVGLSIWAIIALLLPLLSAGRQVGDMAWALIPLWALASSEISRAFLLDEDMTTHLVAAGLGLFMFIMAIIGWMNLLPIGSGQETVVVLPFFGFQVNVVINWVIILGTFILAFVALLLVIAGWSAKSASLGLIWSLCVALGLFLVSNAWGMSIVRQNGAEELWSLAPTAGQADQLMTTLSDFSSWNTGLRDQLVVVSLADSVALRWALRDYPNARFETSLSTTESPPVVITLKESEEPKLAQDYRGQDFVWHRSPGWQGIFPPDFINWLAFRQAPVNQDQIILWARTDIFPGGVSNPTGSLVP
jgi:hypothetical protein